MRQPRPTPCDPQDSTAPGGPTVHYIIEAEAHARDAGRLLEVLAIAEDRPEFRAVAAVLFGAACRLRSDRLGITE